MGLFFKNNKKLEKRDSTQENAEILYKSKLYGEYRGLPQNVIRNNVDVFYIVSLLCGDLASMNINLIKKGEGVVEDYNDYYLNTEPETGKTAYKFWKFVYTNAIFKDQSFVFINRNDKTNDIEGFSFIRNEYVSVVPTLRGDTIDYYELHLPDLEGMVKVKVEDMLHITFNISEDGINGRSPIHTLKDDIEAQVGAKNYVKEYFSNGYYSNQVIKLIDVQDTTRETLKFLRDDFMKDRGENKYAPTFIDSSMEIDTLEMNSELIKILNSANFNTEAVARAFGVPKGKVGLPSPNDSSAQDDIDYHKNTLPRYVREVEQEFSLKLISSDKRKTFKYELDLNKFKYTNHEEEYKESLEMFKLGAITVDELRVVAGYEPLGNDGGQERYLPSSVINIKDIGVNSSEK